MKKTLLVVDDEPAICLILEHYFSADYHVVLTANGQEALTWLSGAPRLDAVIADYEMPLMDGLAFVKHLRANPRYQDVPLLMLSGHLDSNHKIQCLRHGADDYLVKPFNPEELHLRLQNLLRRRRTTESTAS